MFHSNEMSSTTDGAPRSNAGSLLLCLAVIAGAATTAVAQPTSTAPVGSYVLHTRTLADGSIARGAVQLSAASDGSLSLTRSISGQVAAVSSGAVAGADRWVFADPAGGGVAGDRTWATVTASALNLRAGPDGSHPVMDRGVRGSRLLVVGQQGVWRELINRDGRRVWAHGGYMTFETRAVGAVMETVIVADPRGPWGITFTGSTPVSTERWEARSNDLVFMGMGKYAFHEVWDLRSVQGVKVHAILGSDEQDVVELLGARRDLQDDADVEALLDAMALTGEQRDKAKDALDACGRRAKDEGAQLLVTFWEAERGERILERLILSGHSTGGGVWGDDNGYFSFGALEKILLTFPNAARQVEDLMIAGCYSQSLRQVDRFRGMFPDLKSFWAYGDSAPGSYTGATIHNAAWEEVSRGSEPALVTRIVVRGTRKGDNVATWNIVTGYEADGHLRDMALISAELTQLQPTYDEFHQGDQVVTDTQRGPLRDYYRLVQELLGHPDLADADRPNWILMRDQTIRLIFFVAPVSVRFQEAYEAELHAGYDALGLAHVDFSTLTRKEALEAVEAFEAAAALVTPTPEVTRALDLLRRGLIDLHPDLIPHEWV